MDEPLKSSLKKGAWFAEVDETIPALARVVEEITIIKDSEKIITTANRVASI